MKMNKYLQTAQLHISLVALSVFARKLQRASLIIKIMIGASLFFLYPSFPVAATEDAATKEPLPTAKTVIERLLIEIKPLESKKMDREELLKLKKASDQILARLQQLKDFGEEGSRAIQEFLQSQQDVLLPSSKSMSIPGPTGYPSSSLREILIDTLYDMENPTSRTASLEVLKTTSSGAEVFFSARNLEHFSPGTYRTEALQTASRVLAPSQNLNNLSNDDIILKYILLFDVIAHYQACDLIPQIEALAKNNSRLIQALWVTIVPRFPAEEQAEMLQKKIG